MYARPGPLRIPDKGWIVIQPFPCLCKIAPVRNLKAHRAMMGFALNALNTLFPHRARRALAFTV